MFNPVILKLRMSSVLTEKKKRSAAASISGNDASSTPFSSKNFEGATPPNSNKDGSFAPSAEEAHKLEPSKQFTLKRKKKTLGDNTCSGRAIKLQKAAAKRERQEAREKLREKLGDAAPPKEVPRTIENTREYDETVVPEEDDEVQHDENQDEFSAHFKEETTPKILITTSPYAKVKTWKLLYEMQKCIPNAELFTRKGIPLKKVVKQAMSKDYTDLIVVHEDHKQPNGIVLTHLPDGPTAYFKINNLTFTKDLKRKGDSTHHYPELILNNFNTRLGHSIARMFACLFPQRPEFRGRRVVTLHNQRDYIFFRHHRYEFKKEGEKAALLELGPRMTLRLKWLQKGTFDTRLGEFEWVLKVPAGGRMGAPENPELHTYDGVYNGSPSKGDKPIPDFYYRTPTMGTTYIDRVLSRFIASMMWFWFSYHMYYHSGHILGHWYMPYLHEFSDEELGIAADSESDPEYWGEHGRK